MRVPEPITTADLAAATVTLAIAVLVAFGAAAVVRNYAAALRVAPREHGLMLWHVVCVATSVSGIWAVYALAQLDTLGIVMTPRWSRLIAASAFGLLTLTSLVLIGVETRRRLRKSTTTSTVVTEETTTVRGDR